MIKSELEHKIEDACRVLPEGFTISICMEEGAAFVTLGCDFSGYIKLPDSTDKTLAEQIDDAINVALSKEDKPND